MGFSQNPAITTVSMYQGSVNSGKKLPTSIGAKRLFDGFQHYLGTPSIQRESMEDLQIQLLIRCVDQ